MILFTNHPKITGATYRQIGDSRADGLEAAQLPFPVMSFHIDLLPINHPEVTSDENSPTRLFLTNYSKALSSAFDEDEYFHKMMKLCNMRAWSGLNSTSSALSQKNRVPTSSENKYSVVIKHQELAFSQLHFSSSTAKINLIS